MEVVAFRLVGVPTSRFRGVYAFRSKISLQFKWQCLMTVDESRREHLGTFDSELAAAHAFDVRARAVGRSSECNFETEVGLTGVNSEAVSELSEHTSGQSCPLLTSSVPWAASSVVHTSKSQPRICDHGLTTPATASRAWPAGAPPRGDGQPHRVGNYSTGARAEVPQSRFKGVYFVLGGRWEAKITYRSKSKHIGTFDTEEEAARAFDARARYLGVPERCNYDERGNEAMDQASEPFRGVRRSRNKWRAVISVDGQSVNLGIFDTKEQAAEVCRAAECQNAERKRNALSGINIPPRNSAANSVTSISSPLAGSPVSDSSQHRKRARGTSCDMLFDFGPMGTASPHQPVASDILSATMIQDPSISHRLPQLQYQTMLPIQPCQRQPPPQLNASLSPLHDRNLVGAYWVPKPQQKSLSHMIPTQSSTQSITQHCDSTSGRQGQWFSRLNTLGEPEFLFAQVPPANTCTTAAADTSQKMMPAIDTGMWGHLEETQQSHLTSQAKTTTEGSPSWA